MNWAIQLEIGEENDRFLVVPEEGSLRLVASPDGQIISSESKELMALVAHCLDLTGLELCDGLSPYGIECSFTDFNISKNNVDHLSAALSAFDSANSSSTLNRDDWKFFVTQTSSRNLAAIISICGNLGFQQLVYNLVANYEVPEDDWYRQVCGVRSSLKEQADRILTIASTNDSFGPIISRKPACAENCIACATNADDFNPNLCAIKMLFMMTAKYIELTSDDDRSRTLEEFSKGEA